MDVKEMNFHAIVQFLIALSAYDIRVFIFFRRTAQGHPKPIKTLVINTSSFQRMLIDMQNNESGLVGIVLELIGSIIHSLMVPS